MKKKILLNLSCLCMLFGCGNTTECVAMNSRKTADLSTLRSLNHKDPQTILKVCDLDPTNGVSLKAAYSGKKGFDAAVKQIQAEYKADKESALKTWIKAELQKQKKEERNNNRKGFDTIKDTTVMIGGQKVALQALFTSDGEYTKHKFGSNNEKEEAETVIRNLIKQPDTYSDECIKKLEKCLENLPTVKVKDEEDDTELKNFEEIKNTVKITINGNEVEISKLESEKYADAQFKDDDEQQAAETVIRNLIKQPDTYSNECIDTLKKCLENLPTVKEKNEDENKDTLVDVEKLITSYDIQLISRTLTSYKPQAAKQAALYLLKEKYNQKSLIQKEDEDLVILLVSIAKEKQKALYENKKKELLKNDALVSILYGSTKAANAALSNVTIQRPFGIGDEAFTDDTVIKIENKKTLFPEAVMTHFNIQDRDAVCNYMIRAYKEKHLNFYHLTDEAKARINGKDNLEEKLEALGLSDKSDE